MNFDERLATGRRRTASRASPRASGAGRPRSSRLTASKRSPSVSRKISAENAQPAKRLQQSARRRPRSPNRSRCGPRRTRRRRSSRAARSAASRRWPAPRKPSAIARPAMISDVPGRNIRPSTICTCGRSASPSAVTPRITTLRRLARLALGQADQHHRLLRHELACRPRRSRCPAAISTIAAGRAVDAALHLGLRALADHDDVVVAGRSPPASRSRPAASISTVANTYTTSAMPPAVSAVVSLRASEVARDVGEREWRPWRAPQATDAQAVDDADARRAPRRDEPRRRRRRRAAAPSCISDRLVAKRRTPGTACPSRLPNAPASGNVNAMPSDAADQRDRRPTRRRSAGRRSRWRSRCAFIVAYSA